MSAHIQIAEWSKDQPSWRRDALRRLLTGVFAPTDENDVLELLKAEHKLLETAISAEPLLPEHMPTPGVSTDQLNLLSVSNVANTNRLAPGQTLSFSPTGITLVYGDNGSGKSGYARILKKACRARVVETILHNVFDANAPQSPATAIFEIAVGADKPPKPVHWEDGKAAPTELARIAVFDSKCAAVYVDNENQITFIPYNLDCFERLARLCDRLKERLTSERDGLRIAVAVAVLVLPEGTTSQSFLSELATKSPAELDAATEWTAQHAARLKELSAVVTEPEKRALQGRQLHAQLKSVRDSISSAEPHLTVENLQRLKQAKLLLDGRQEAARIAASQTFSKEPLTGVGSAAWRTLYEAARAYSEKEAYKGNTFPLIGDDARCVLCHQTLGDQGSDRIQRFDDFVRGEVTTQADEAAVAWEQAVKTFRNGVATLTPL